MKIPKDFILDLNYKKVLKSLFREQIVITKEDFICSALPKLYSQAERIWDKESAELIKLAYSTVDYLKGAPEEIQSLLFSYWAKNPKRQSFAEKAFYCYLQELEKIKILDKVSKLPNKSKWVVNGEIVDRYPEKTPVKSVDFKTCLKNKTLYIWHKYIEEAGGAQDNQFYDILNCSKNCSLNKDKSTYFLFVCAGDYFTDKKINILKTSVSTKNIIFIDTLNLKELLSELN